MAKLELFKLTAEGFLGVFIGSKRAYPKRIQIFDFFCGPGMDSQGRLGSPVMLLQHLKKLEPTIRQYAYDVGVFLNDAEHEKIQALKDRLRETGLDDGPYQLRFSSKEFLSLFPEDSVRMEGAANGSD